MFQPLLVALVTAATATGLTATAAPATAATCWGDWCSGQDPVDTGCAYEEGANYVAYANVYDGRGSLYLYWSPTCKTNWAKLYMHPWVGTVFPSGTLKAIQRDTGYTQQWGVPQVQGGNPKQTWTDMIYSPAYCVKARFESSWGPVETTCV
ncbi:DUF2690 domain-containing protein [Micromonospora chalcea]